MSAGNTPRGFELSESLREGEDEAGRDIDSCLPPRVRLLAGRSPLIGPLSARSAAKVVCVWRLEMAPSRCTGVVKLGEDMFHRATDGAS